MNKIKIVHASDMHFDTPFREIGIDKGNISREEIKEVFSSIVNFCNDNKVQVLLLAGDIFDNMTVNKQTIYFLENTLKKLQLTRVFISPGNHDPYGKESFYKVVKWPEKVHVFKGNLEKVYIRELGLNVWGAAFTKPYERETLIRDFTYDLDNINIMVIHGEICRANDKNEYNPISLELLENSKMDYVALGHRHQFSGIKKARNTFYAYSGCIQGRGFDESDDKGIIYGDVYKGNVDLKFIKMSKREYYTLDVDISDSLTHQEVLERILSSVLKESRVKDFYKITLCGQICEDFNIDINVLHSNLQEHFYYIKIIDKTTKKIDLDKMSEGYSVKGIFTKKLLDLLNEADNEEDKEIIKMALNYGISSMTEDEVNSL